MTRAKSQASRAPSQRQLKVGELIRHALAEIFARGEVMDEVVSKHSLTVPEVRMTPDLKLATAYVMPLGGGEAAEVVAHLEKHKRFLRGEVARARGSQIHAGAQIQGGRLVRSVRPHRRSCSPRPRSPATSTTSEHARGEAHGAAAQRPSGQRLADLRQAARHDLDQGGGALEAAL